MELHVAFAGNKKESIMLKSTLEGLPRNIVRGLNRFGFFIERNVKESLKPGNPTKFFYKSYSWTLRSRTGLLRASITTDKASLQNMTTKIGPAIGFSNKKGTYGGYGAANEFGATISVTDRMRAYLHYRGIHLKKSTTEIIIPSRPWLFPVFKKSIDKGTDLMMESIISPLGGSNVGSKYDIR